MNDLAIYAKGRQLVWLDLCSGLGGASQPALDRGWKVIRVDIDPRFKPDIVADVRNLPLKPFHVDVLWASPPCIEFSKWGMRHKYPTPVHPASGIELMQACKEAVERLNPRYWVIENVRAAREFLTKSWGRVLCCVPGHVFWGNAPFLVPNTHPHKYRLKGRGEQRQQERAKIPYEIGLAICKAVESRDE